MALTRDVMSAADSVPDARKDMTPRLRALRCRRMMMPRYAALSRLRCRKMMRVIR